MDIPSRLEDFVAAGLLLTFGSLGFATNLFIFFRLHRFWQNQTFTFLLMSRIFSNLVILTVFLLWTAPIILSGNSSISSASHIFGFIGSMSYMNIVFLEPFILINRLIAVYNPLKYDRICGRRTTFIQIAVSWILAFANTASEIHPFCSYIFHYSDLAWGYEEGECGQDLTLYAFLIPAYTCNCISIMLSFVIAVKLCKVSYFNPPTSRTAEKRRYLRNSRLFIQSFLQFCVFSVDLLNNTFLPVFEDRLETFFAFTFTWELVHVIDGLIVFFFRKDLRQSLFPSKVMLVQVTFSPTDKRTA